MADGFDRFGQPRGYSQIAPGRDAPRNTPPGQPGRPATPLQNAITGPSNYPQDPSFAAWRAGNQNQPQSVFDITKFRDSWLNSGKLNAADLAAHIKNYAGAADHIYAGGSKGDKLFWKNNNSYIADGVLAQGEGGKGAQWLEDAGASPLGQAILPQAGGTNFLELLARLGGGI